jgi:hypothetical protein
LLFYNPAGVEQAVGPMRFVRTSFDRNEGRQDRRYPVPPIVVAIDGVEYSTVNWSLGGFLLNGFFKPVDCGAPISGTFCLVDRPETVEFTGTVIRTDQPERGNLAVRFNDLGERGVTILDRVIARRMFRR